MPTVPKLNNDELVKLMKSMSSAAISDSDEERMLMTFCLNCADPFGALCSVLDAPRGTSDEEMAAVAIALPPREVSTVPLDELPPSHPLRLFVVSSGS